jgi:uncharacterized glyoxalase superfamily protein PhnB
MDDKTKRSTPELATAWPQLFVIDIVASCAWYESKLGFAIAFLYGEPPFYGQVVRGGARLNLRQLDAMPYQGHIREREQLLAAYIPVANVAALFEEYRLAGADFQQKLETKPWGAQEFVVRDPDGNLLCFGSD